MDTSSLKGELNMSIGVNAQVQKNILFVDLSGELDQSTSQQVKNKLTLMLESYEIQHIVFNLKRLDFMDSSGIGIILGRYNQLKDHGGRVFVVGMNPVVSRVFYLSGLNQIITIIEDERAISKMLEGVS